MPAAACSPAKSAHAPLGVITLRHAALCMSKTCPIKRAVRYRRQSTLLSNNMQSIHSGTMHSAPCMRGAQALCDLDKYHQSGESTDGGTRLMSIWCQQQTLYSRHSSIDSAALRLHNFLAAASNTLCGNLCSTCQQYFQFRLACHLMIMSTWVFTSTNRSPHANVN